MEVTSLVGLVASLIAIVAGGRLLVLQFRTGKSEAKKNDADANLIAVEAANMVVETMRGAFERQTTRMNELEQTNTKLEARVADVEKQNEKLKEEVKDCKDDREILVRIVQDNRDTITIRSDDAKRLGI